MANGWERLESEWNNVDPQREAEDSDFNSFYDHRIGMFSPAEYPDYREDDSEPDDGWVPPKQEEQKDAPNDNVPF